MKKLIIFVALCVLPIEIAQSAEWSLISGTDIGTATLFSAVTSTGAGATIDVNRWKEKSVYIKATSVTSGGVVAIQTSHNGSDWVTLHSVTVSSNGTTEVAISGLFHRFIRANLTSRTDGTYTVTMLLNGYRR